MGDTLRNITLDDEVGLFLEQCAALASEPVTAETAPRFRSLQAEEVKLRKRLDETRKAEKEPHLQACRDVDGRFNPLIAKVQDAVRAITVALTRFLEAEEAKRRAEAEAKRKAAEDEQRRAAELAAAAKAEADPFEAFDKSEAARQAEAQASALARQANEPVKVNVAGDDGSRAAGLRTVGWIVEVEDPAALVAHYAHRSEFIELAKKMAAQEAKFTKGQCKVPGVRIIADRRAA